MEWECANGALKSWAKKVTRWWRFSSTIILTPFSVSCGKPGRVNSLSDYDFALPDDLIAQKPVEPRDSSRLLVVDRATGTWQHRIFSDLPEYLDSSDILVANNTQVLKARLIGRRLSHDEAGAPFLGGKIEFLMLEEVRPRVWEGSFHAAAKHKPGVEFEIPTPDGKGLRGKLVRGASDSPHGTIEVEFDRDPVESGAGVVPLPPYIDRASEQEDEGLYQTVYARELGSAAAPTAGLHFTPRLLKQLKEKGVDWEEVTLHVGLGTFRPVKAQDIRDHKMHDERYEISQTAAEHITRAKLSGKRTVAVGTTSVRTLESAWRGEGAEGRLEPGIARTSLYIYPGGRKFNVVDRMITNFHLPKSSLLMLVSALGGHELMMAAYREAVKERYRFFSYGDAMLIL